MKKFINDNFPFFLHGGDYNPEQWLDYPGIIDSDMKLMKEAHCNEMTVGIFSWATLEPEEGVFDFSFLDDVIDRLSKTGSAVVLATPSGARPRWMAEKYPEVLRVNDRGERYHFGERHNHCLSSPVYREKVRIINKKLAERYGNNPSVVCWHISNEYSGECFCPLCQENFRKYLKDKYHNDINELNHAYWTSFWSHKYNNFSEIEPPSSLGDRCVHGLNLDWKRFTTDQTISFIKNEIAPIKEVNPSVPCTINMMFAFDGLDYNKIGDVIDIASWDSYPEWHSGDDEKTAEITAFWHDYYRSLKKRPFMLMESTPSLVNWKPVNNLKRPGLDVLSSIQAIAHGSDTVQYFQWRKGRGSSEKFHGAVVDHVGTSDTRVFKSVATTGKTLEKLHEVCGTITKSKVALLIDWDNMWALNDAQAFSNNTKKYLDTCYSYHNIFWKRGINCDIVSPKSNLSGYSLVIAPMLYMTHSETENNLKNYVENGGVLYATYFLGMVDDTDLCHLGGYPGGLLKDVFGIWNEEVNTLYPEQKEEVIYNGKKYILKDYREFIHLKGAKKLATCHDRYFGESPAFTVNCFGKGMAYYQAFRDCGDFSDDIFDNILSELNLTGDIYKGNNILPYGVSLQERTDGKNSYIFIENFDGDSSKRIELTSPLHDILSGNEVSEVILPPYGFAVLKK